VLANTSYSVYIATRKETRCQ